MAFVVLAMGTAAGFFMRHHRPPPPVAIGLERIPLKIGEFQGRELPTDRSVFAYLGADEMIDRVYVNDEAGRAVKLSVVFARGWRALHSPRDCFKNQGWSVIEDRSFDVPADEPTDQVIHANRLIMSKHGARMVTVYTFATSRATTGSWLRHSLRMALGEGNKGGVLIVAVADSRGPGDDDSAADAAVEIVSSAYHELRGAWDDAGKAELDAES